MFTKEQLLEDASYLLTKYQNEIYRQIVRYMEEEQLSQKDIAIKLGVSNAYVSQILNGRFNFTLKKLIELGLLIGKVPNIEFITPDKFWAIQDRKIRSHHSSTRKSDLKNGTEPSPLRKNQFPQKKKSSKKKTSGILL